MNADEKVVNTKALFNEINDSKAFGIRLKAASGNRSDFYNTVDIIIKELTNISGVELTKTVNSYPIRSNLWLFGVWRKFKDTENPMKSKTSITNTKRAYAVINNNEIYNLRLASAAGQYQDCRDAFDNTMTTIIRDLVFAANIDVQHTAGSLKSNLWRFGLWRKIKIEPFKNDEQPKPENTMYTNSSDRICNLINNYPPYQARLAAAAGPNKDNKEEFYEVVSDMILDTCTNNNIIDTFLEKPIVDFLWNGKWRGFNSFAVEADFAELEARTLAYMARNNPPQEEEEFEMEITTPILIDGRDAAEIDDSQLIHFIGNLEDKISKREKLKTTSSRITKDIENMQKQCKQLAEILDERE